MNLDEKAARFSLANIKRMTPLKFKHILDEVGNISQFCREYNIPISRKSLDEINNYIVFGEETYPEPLAHIADPPAYIYIAGNLKQIPQKCVAIVGTRNITDYGLRAAKEVTEEYVKLGFCIISGLASGVDSVVHKTCLELSGITVAVLGGNVNKPYPISNSGLYNEIKKTGCIISEFNYDQGYAKFMFARRNRIIAGLSQKVIVVEAPEKSGAMITAKYAIDYNRDLVAIPGGIFQKMSAGCNRLIFQNSAQIYFKQSNSICPELSDDTDKLIFKTISAGYNSLDEISQKVYMSRPELLNRLMNLEMQEIIAKDLFDRYIVLS